MVLGPIAVDVHPTAGLELINGCRIYSVAINKVAQTASPYPCKTKT